MSGMDKPLLVGDIVIVYLDALCTKESCEDMDFTSRLYDLREYLCELVEKGILVIGGLKPSLATSCFGLDLALGGILEWLEQEGVLRYDKEHNKYFLNCARFRARFRDFAEYLAKKYPYLKQLVEPLVR